MIYYNKDTGNKPLTGGTGDIKGKPQTHIPSSTNVDRSRVLSLGDKDKLRISREANKYYNPEIEENITSGDPRQDFLYRNQWLMDTPIVGNYIKNKAKNIAEVSGGWESLTPEHVKDLEADQSSLEKYKGRVYNGENINETNLLDQYFSEDPLFPTSKYKPSSDYMEFLPSYSIKNNFNTSYRDDSQFRDKFKNQINSILAGDAWIDSPDETTVNTTYNKFLKNKKPIYIPSTEDSVLKSMLNIDLGGHKVGMAWDKERNLPYISLSDAWDFEPTHYSKKWVDNEDEIRRQRSKVQAALMHKAGHPFKVYDRFYFDPNTRQYIADDALPTLKKAKGGIIYKK